MIRRASTVITAALLGWSSVGCPAAEAAFTRSSTSSPVVYTSGTLQAAATVSATCSLSGSTYTANVTWTGSPSTFANGYRITSDPASQQVDVAGSARSATLTGLALSTVYTFTVVATYRSWSSPARTTASMLC